MQCLKCGKTISDDSRFCRFCGAETAVSFPQKSVPVLAQDLYFQTLDTNATCERKINEWLSRMQIRLKSVSVVSGGRTGLTGMQSVPQKVTFTYVNDSSAPQYFWGYVSSMAILGNAMQKTDEDFEKWKAKNPQCRILWSGTGSSRYIRGSAGQAASRWFIYTLD